MNTTDKIRVRFPNDDTYSELPKDKVINNFMVEKEFEDEVFGWYGGIYISVRKEDLAS